MWLHYVITFWLLGGAFIVIFAKSRLLENIYLIISLVVFWILSSFRGIGVGNDNINYYEYFNDILNTNSLAEAINVSRFEIGYASLNFIVSRFTDNYNILLALISAFYFLCIYIFVKRYSKNKVLVVLLAFAFSFFYDIFNPIRQCVAVGVFLLSTKYLINRNCIKYFICVILAITFHSSSVILFPLYFFPNIDFKNKMHISCVCLVTILTLFLLDVVLIHFLEYLPYFRHYYLNSIYAEGGIRTASVAFWGIRSFIVILVFCSSKVVEKCVHVDQQGFIFNLLILCECIIATFAIKFNLLDRLENLFCLGFLVAITNQLEFLTSKVRIMVTICIVFVGMVYLSVLLIFRSNWYGIFPYSICF